MRPWPPALEICLAAALYRAALAAPWTWKEEPGKLELYDIGSGAVLWGFHYGASATKPFLHPLSVGGGSPLTALRPPDHPWHLGLWFSWKFINGVNYWEEDRASGLAAGRTTWTNVVLERRPDASAVVTMEVAYRPGVGAPAVLSERRRLQFGAPATDGSWALDWEAEFTVGEMPIELAASPVNPARTAGGYAGLLCRISADTTDWHAVDDRNRTDLAIHGEPALAVDFQMRADGRPAGIAMLDHPDNPGSPVPWFLRLDSKKRYGLSGPGFLFAGPRTYAPGQRWRLRYRVIVHPEWWSVDRLRRELAKFSSPPN
ncbi:MAG: PmoA family protein [Kiritimatiellae bacterium]|nr:PmoA family protein [Kiritimatiellia bacterium]